MSIKVLKLFDGLEVVAEVVEETDADFTVRKPSALRMVSHDQIGLTIFSPLIDPEDDIKFYKHGLIAVMDPTQEIKNEFERMHSKLMTPPDAKKKLIV